MYINETDASKENNLIREEDTTRQKMHFKLQGKEIKKIEEKRRLKEKWFLCFVILSRKT
jgi:hypothetical protein